MKKHGSCWWMMILVVITVTFGMASGEALGAQKGTLIIAQAEECGNLIPVIWQTDYDRFIEQCMYNCLVVPDEKLKMVGQLAKDWEISADGKTYTFHLHKNVKWHDGVPLTARDVAFTFKSLGHPKYDMGATGRVEPLLGFKEYRSGEASDFAGIKVIDDHTVQFTTREVYAPLLSNLYIQVIPEHLLKDLPPSEWAKSKWNRAPVGTGPFKFVQWKSGQYVEMEANKDYFRGPPKVERVIFRFGDANTMLAAFTAKEVDVVPVPLTETASIKQIPHADLFPAEDLNMFYVGFNLRNEHFRDRKVRQAMAYAINKEEIVKSIMGEFGRVTHSVFSTAHWSHSPNLIKYSFDLAKAKALLKEAGYAPNSKGFFEKDGKELEFIFEVPLGKKEREKTAVLLKQYWDALGIKCEIRQLDFPTLISKLVPKDKAGKQRAVTAEDFAVFILGYGIKADPGVDYATYYNSKNMPPNGYNFCGFNNPEMDVLLEQQFKETNFDKRQKMFWQIGEKLSEEQVWIPIYELKIPYAINKRVQGFAPDYRGVGFLCENWSLKD